MSATSLFIVGFLVALIVAAALALLVYAAILDGRDARARKLAERSAPSIASGSIVDIARETGQFSTRASALDRAGLTDRLVDRPEREGLRVASLPDGVFDSVLASSAGTSKPRTGSSM